MSEYRYIAEQHGTMPPNILTGTTNPRKKTMGKKVMKPTHSDLRVGNSVRVKDGTQDPDLHADISGWQGRVSNIEPSGDEILLTIQWDNVTLKHMPAAVIEQCEEQGLDWAEMTLSASDVEPSRSRDTQQDVAKTKQRLSNQYGWVALGEEGKRIQKVLAATETDDDLDEFGAWEQHFERNLRFPFDAVVAEFQERGPLRSGDQVVVTGIADATDERYGIIVDLKVGRHKYAFPLCDLEVANKQSPNYHLVKDYAIWFANR